MKSKRDYDLMTIATIGIVISLTSTSLNLLFFSISERARGAFSTLDFMGRTTMVFLFTMAFVASEVHGSNEYAKAEKTRYHDKNAKEPEPIKAKANNETISEPRVYLPRRGQQVLRAIHVRSHACTPSQLNPILLELGQKDLLVA